MSPVSAIVARPERLDVLAIIEQNTLICTYLASSMNADVTLEDKYDLPAGRVYMTGTQALVRLMLAQKARDQFAGLNTGGFVSGYRGSPLGAVDQEMWRAKKRLDAAGSV